MGWENIFAYIDNILKIITLIGPIVDFVESLFNRIFPGEKKGDKKKAAVLGLVSLVVSPGTPNEGVSKIIDWYVSEKNSTGEFKHSAGNEDLGIGKP